jgi:hypothetical protein
LIFRSAEKGILRPNTYFAISDLRPEDPNLVMVKVLGNVKAEFLA